MRHLDIRKTIVYILLLCVLGISLWMGWSDYLFFRPEMSQEEIRTSIHFYIRSSIQFSVQVVIPALILGYFTREFLGRNKV